MPGWSRFLMTIFRGMYVCTYKEVSVIWRRWNHVLQSQHSRLHKLRGEMLALSPSPYFSIGLHCYTLSDLFIFKPTSIHLRGIPKRHILPHMVHLCKRDEQLHRKFLHHSVRLVESRLELNRLLWDFSLTGLNPWGEYWIRTCWPHNVPFQQGQRWQRQIPPAVGASSSLKASFLVSKSSYIMY